MQSWSKIMVGLVAVGGVLLVQQASGDAQVRPGGPNASSVQISVTDLRKEVNAL